MWRSVACIRYQQGDLTVKEQTQDATFEGTASLAGGKLTATVATTAKLSDFDAHIDG